MSFTAALDASAPISAESVDAAEPLVTTIPPRSHGRECAARRHRLTERLRSPRRRPDGHRPPAPLSMEVPRMSRIPLSLARRLPLAVLASLALVAGGCSKASEGDDAKEQKSKSVKISGEKGEKDDEKSDKAAKTDDSAAKKDDADPKKAADPKENKAIERDSTALVQEVPFGSIGWTIEADGVVKADARDKAGAPIKEGLQASVEGADGTAVPLQPIEGSTLWGATVPAFQADLTPIHYAVQLAPPDAPEPTEPPATGVFYVPAGGTKVLLAPPTATITAVAPAPAGAEVVADVKGPHGGVVQLVGPDRVELVSDQDSGEVRAYVLDAELKPIVVGERRLTLGVVADHPEVVGFEVAPGGAYFVAGWGIKADPLNLTLALRIGPAVHVGIVGWRPGVRFVAVRPAPWHVRVKTGWGPPAKVLVRGRVVEGHGPVHWARGEGGKGKVEVKGGGGPKVEVKGGGGPKVEIRPKIEIKAKGGGGKGKK
jgi:hypothetical protein